MVIGSVAGYDFGKSSDDAKVKKRVEERIMTLRQTLKSRGDDP